MSQAGSLQSIDSGIDTVRLSSTYKSSVADITYFVGDDKEKMSRGVSMEETATCQQPKDMKGLFSRFSDFESVILDQLQSFRKGIERLQQGQDELKKSVTAEMSQLRKQVKELKVTVTALQQSSLVSLLNIPNFILSIIQSCSYQYVMHRQKHHPKLTSVWTCNWMWRLQPQPPDLRKAWRLHQ